MTTKLAIFQPKEYPLSAIRHLSHVLYLSTQPHSHVYIYTQNSPTQTKLKYTNLPFLKHLTRRREHVNHNNNPPLLPASAAERQLQTEGLRSDGISGRGIHAAVPAAVPGEQEIGTGWVVGDEVWIPQSVVES